MADDAMPVSGAMEAGGAYNKYATLPARGGRFGISHFEAAARIVPFDAGHSPIVIADYGSSQGKNSLSPMRVAIDALRARAGKNRAILVYHEDLPANDFNALFDVLDKDSDRYGKDEPEVFPCAIARSFYERVLPADHVHLGWSSYAAMWISRIPTRIHGHFFVPRSAGEARAAFERQGAQDWEAFLALRAAELRPAGRLVISVPGADEDGVTGFEGIMDHANAVLAEMVEQGAISAEERARMTLGAWPRRRSDLLRPFAGGARFRDLEVEHCETNALADAAWVEYQQDGDAEVLARTQALFFRTVFAPTLAGALERSRGPDRVRAFSEGLANRLERRLAAKPAPVDSLVETIVIAKAGGK